MKSIVITEKPSQARDVRAAVGAQYGDVLPAQGHLLVLQEPEDVNPEWKQWGFEVLKPPNGFYPTKADPRADPGARKRLAAIKAALKSAGRVIVATDCDREGTLIGGELVDHFRFRGEVLRAVFTAQDEKTIRDAFRAARPWAEFENEFAAGQARQQADQVFNLSLTRAASSALRAPGARGVIGIGRVKTPTLAIVCMREIEIRNFRPQDYFEVAARATTAAGSFEMRHAPDPRLTDRAPAEAVARAAEGFVGPLAVKTEEKRRGPPRLMDLPALQKKGGSWGWTAEKTLQVAQALYEEFKILTYPRAEAKHLAENQIADVPTIVAGLRRLERFAAVKVGKPAIRKGKGGHFCDKCLEGVSHHAIIPNVNTMGALPATYGRLPADARRLFDLVAANYLAAVMPDYEYKLTTVTLVAGGAEFKARGETPVVVGWKAVYREDDSGEDAGEPLPPLKNGEAAKLTDARVEAKQTKPPPRYTEGTLIEAMENAWKFVDDADLKGRLKEAKGIGTPATRSEVIKGLKLQNLIAAAGKAIVPTTAGLELYGVLKSVTPELVDPAVTAMWETRLDGVVLGRHAAPAVVDDIAWETGRLIGLLKAQKGRVAIDLESARKAVGRGGKQQWKRRAGGRRRKRA